MICSRPVSGLTSLDVSPSQVEPSGIEIHPHLLTVAGAAVDLSDSTHHFPDYLPSENPSAAPEAGRILPCRVLQRTRNVLANVNKPL